MTTAVQPRGRVAYTGRRFIPRVDASEVPRSPMTGFQPSIAFACFCLYIIATTTYRVPVGNVSMIVALATLPLEPQRIRMPIIIRLILGLIVWSVLGFGTTEFPEVVLDAITDFSKVGLVVFVAVNVLTSTARMRVFLLVQLLAYLAYPIRGTLNNYIHGETLMGRAIWNGAFKNPNDLAGLALLELSLVLGLLEVEKLKSIRLLAQIALLALPVMVILTASRAAFIAMLVFGLVSLRSHLRDPRKIIGTLAICGLIAWVAPSSVWTRISTMKEVADLEEIDLNNESGSSTVQRLEIWKVARSIIASSPIIGVGFGAYPQTHQKFATRPEFNMIARGARDAHSTYLRLMAETGLIGFGFFGAIVYYAARDGVRARKLMKKKSALAGQLFYMQLGFLAYLVAGLWASYGQIAYTYVHLALIAAMTNLVHKAGAPAAAPLMRGQPKNMARYGAQRVPARSA